jgi:predicted nucleic acid-binding protein
MFVLDASIAVTWALPDEDAPGTEFLRRLARIETAVVPMHWILEVTNALRAAVRSRRLAPGEPREVLDRIREQPIEIDPETMIRGWLEIPEIADTYELTTYDAAYLELALRLGAPLATLDQALAKAARAAKVPLLA